MELSVIIPVYNEIDNLPDLHDSITSAFKNRIEDYEIILVNDGSTDGSANVIEEIAARDHSVKPIHFELNAGQTAAIHAGIQKAQGRFMALIDGDLQTDPRDIPILLKYLRNVDFVNGMRIRRQDTRLRKISSRIGNGVRNWITGDRVYDTGCPMKVFKREVAESFMLFDGFHRFLPTLARMNGFRVSEVAVRHRPRMHGKSKYGVLNRAFVGLMDAIVIGWLRKRKIRYWIRGETLGEARLPRI